MSKLRLPLFLVILALCAPSTVNAATAVVCLNKATQKVAVRNLCITGEVTISGKNLVVNTATTVTPTPIPFSGTTPAINYAGCYVTSAKKSASAFDGRVAVGVLCSRTTDIMINDQFNTSETSGAKPVLEHKEVRLSGKLPNGVEYGMLALGGVNKFYEVQVSIVCCPFVSK